MALIHCPECGNQVSSMAPTCPQLRRPGRPDWRAHHPRLFSAPCLAAGAGLMGYRAARLAFGF